MTSPIRVYLICDNELGGEAMSTALAARETLTVAGATKRFSEALVALESEAVDIALVDATDVGARALELVRVLADALPDVKLLTLGLDSPQQVLDFLEAGANGYAMKNDPLAAVIKAIAAVAAGRPACSPRITAMVFARIVELKRRESLSAPDETPGTLSARENQVLRLLALGLRNKEIAQRLGIALCTAGNHVQRILDKLEVHRRRDAIRRAYEQGLIDGALPLSPI